MRSGRRTVFGWPGLAVATVVVGVTLSQCTGRSAVPMPLLDGVESGVAAKVRACRAAVVADPTADHWALYALTLHAHLMLTEAEFAYLQTAAAGDSAAAFEFLHLAGMAAMVNSRPAAALQHFNRALSLKSDYTPTHLHAAIVAERLGLVGQARRHYERVNAYGRSSHACLGLGRLALVDGDAKAALAYLREALVIYPDHHEVHEALARTYARLGERDKSRAAAERAGDHDRVTQFVDPLFAKVEAEAVDVQTLLMRGHWFAENNDHAKAIEQFELVIAERPQHPGAHLALASVLYSSGMLTQARVHVDLLLAQDRQQALALELRARLLIDLGETQAAKRDLQTLLARQPAHEWARAALEKLRRR